MTIDWESTGVIARPHVVEVVARPGPVAIMGVEKYHADPASKQPAPNERSSQAHVQSVVIYFHKPVGTKAISLNRMGLKIRIVQGVEPGDIAASHISVRAIHDYRISVRAGVVLDVVGVHGTHIERFKPPSMPARVRRLPIADNAAVIERVMVDEPFAWTCRSADHLKAIVPTRASNAVMVKAVPNGAFDNVIRSGLIGEGESRDAGSYPRRASIAHRNPAIRDASHATAPGSGTCQDNVLAPADRDSSRAGPRSNAGSDTDHSPVARRIDCRLDSCCRCISRFRRAGYWKISREPIGHMSIPHQDDAKNGCHVPSEPLKA